jgi:hypothetical protein
MFRRWGGVASKKNLLNVYLSEDVDLVYVCVAKENRLGVISSRRLEGR